MIYFDREEQKELLLLDTRQRILEEIYKQPGIHFRELSRKTGLATGQLEYHLDRMIKAGLIQALRDGRYLRYYPAGGEGFEIAHVLNHLYRPKTRSILLHMLENGEVTHEELRRFLNVSSAAVTWNMKRLVEADIVLKKRRGKNVVYTLKSPKIIETALKIYRGGLLDELAAKLEEMWEW